MQFIKVNDWQKLQHYKDRNPPWIKLYNYYLEDYDFSRLEDKDKLHLMLIWLLASRLDNKIPNDPHWIKKKIGVSEEVNIEELIRRNFLSFCDDASKPLAEGEQGADTEREGEQSKAKQSEREMLPLFKNAEQKSFFDRFFKEYPKKENKDKAAEEFLDALQVTGVDPEILIVKAKLYAASLKGEEKFAVQPQKWLKDRRWTDEVNAKLPPSEKDKSLMTVQSKIWRLGREKSAGHSQSDLREIRTIFALYPEFDAKMQEHFKDQFVEHNLKKTEQTYYDYVISEIQKMIARSNKVK